MIVSTILLYCLNTPKLNIEDMKQREEIGVHPDITHPVNRKHMSVVICVPALFEYEIDEVPRFAMDKDHALCQ